MAYTEVLTTKEAAAYLRITTRTLYRRVQAGLIPAARFGMHWRFSRAALEKYLRAQDSPRIDIKK